MNDINKLLEKNIEELIVFFFLKISHIFHYLVQIINVVYSDEDKKKTLEKLQENKKCFLKNNVTQTHIDEYSRFLLNYKSLDWIIGKLKKLEVIDKEKWGKLFVALLELIEERNNLAQGGFGYEDKDSLVFYRERYNFDKQKFEEVLKGDGGEWIIKNITKADKLFIIFGIIAIQLEKGYKLDNILSEYLDKDLNMGLE